MFQVGNCAILAARTIPNADNEILAVTRNRNMAPVGSARYAHWDTRLTALNAERARIGEDAIVVCPGAAAELWNPGNVQPQNGATVTLGHGCKGTFRLDDAIMWQWIGAALTPGDTVTITFTLDTGNDTGAFRVISTPSAAEVVADTNWITADPTIMSWVVPAGDTGFQILNVGVTETDGCYDVVMPTPTVLLDSAALIRFLEGEGWVVTEVSPAQWVVSSELGDQTVRAQMVTSRGLGGLSAPLVHDILDWLDNHA